MSALADRVALITGGAHRVGRGIALALARAGAHVVVHYHTAAHEADETVQAIAALGRRALAVQADLRDPAQVERMFDAAAAHFTHLDVLVNSAGIMERTDALEISVEQWDRTLEVNLRAPFLCSQHAARRMPAEGGGVIVNIADVAGLRPWPHYVHHSVSKAGLIMLTQTLALALAPRVRVNAVVPGPVAMPQGWEAEHWRSIWERLPLQRAGTPDDVGAAVVYLAQADFATGSVLTVDGGDLLL
jgi:NAD(P)-dependent dehydrogenase (short-subunit alcohol dehydrogenase family)